MSSETEKPDADLQPIDNIVYNKFVERFNEKYGDHLLEEQKELISKYISSFADNGLELKIYLNEEIGRLKSEMNASLDAKEIKEDVDMLSKTKKVQALLESSRARHIDASLIEDVAKIQALVKEINE